jgi:hypothetical protein
MKNTGFNAWKARLEFMGQEFPFTKPEEGIVTIKNEEGRLHADNEPAWRSPTRIIWYRDGRKHGVDADIHGSITYYYENIRIPPRYHQAVGEPEILTVEEVLKHQNAEIRYVGIKIIGYDRIRTHKNCKLVDTCKKTGMELFSIKGIFDDPVCVLKVINSTAEPDGTFKNYYLTVPPNMKKCKEAVAWTFRMTADDYAPMQET